jgi:hypothetical protein
VASAAFLGSVLAGSVFTGSSVFTCTLPQLELRRRGVPCSSSVRVDAPDGSAVVAAGLS